MHLERNPDGSELRITVNCPGRKVYARVWRVQVGTVPLYMLDTNIEPNNEYDQDITNQLYGGDIDMRIHQENYPGYWWCTSTESVRVIKLLPII